MSRRVLWVSALLLSACGGHSAASPTPRGPVKLVPFDSALPASLAAHPGAPAPACRAAQLHVEGKGLALVPAPQAGGLGTLVLRNRGSAPCSLTGRPSVRFVGGTAPPPQVQKPVGPTELEFPKVAPPDASLQAIAPGHAAVLRINWSNWCPRASVAARQKGIRPPRALRVTLPHGGGSLDADYTAVVPCDHERRPSVLGVRPFAPEPVTAATAFTSAPLTVTAHPLDGGKGTLRARRGEELRFAVELRNHSTTATVRFDRCPLVAEKFAPVGPTEAHQLNCDAAAPIRPGRAQWFEMRVRVPRDAPLGPNGLFWRLDPAGQFGPQAVARVVVGK